MTSEHLLQAMGLLDDDLIQEAEQPLRAPRRAQLRHWAPLAACLVLVLTLSYGLSHITMGGASTGAASQNSAGAAGESLTPDSSGSAAGSAAPGESSGTWEPGPSAYVLLDGQSYLFCGQTVSQLPQEAEEVGVLSLCGDGAPSPCTDQEAYVGCTVFAASDGRLFVLLPQGGYGIFEPAEPAS